MLFAQIITLLRSKDLILKKGTILDSTIISAPSSTKNKEHKRDPEAHSVKKGNEWKFGYKAHVGVDSKSGQYKVIKNLFSFRKTRCYFFIPIYAVLP